MKLLEALWKKKSQLLTNWSKQANSHLHLMSHSNFTYTTHFFFQNNAIENHHVLPSAVVGFSFAWKMLGSNSEKGQNVFFWMAMYISAEVDAAAVPKVVLLDGMDLWGCLVPAHGTSHSVRSEDCSSLRVLRLVRRSSTTGLFFPVGVRHSISSRVSWLSWSLCSSLATICSKFSVLGWPSHRSRSKSTWKK